LNQATTALISQALSREHQPFIFEEGNVSGGMSPDGRWLILADWQFRNVVEVENGHEATWEEVVPNHGLTQLFGLRGAGGGRTGLYGFRDGEAGWFVHYSTGTFFTGLTIKKSIINR
jgi:hypothetical protein